MATVPVLHVTIETQDLGLLQPDTTGLPETVQAVRVTVHDGERSSRHVVVRPGAPHPVTKSDFQAVAGLFADCQTSLVVADGDGRIDLLSSPAEESTLLAACAAAATIKRSWGWDESPTIHVSIACPAEHRFVLDPTYEGGSWVVRQSL
jgi:hypothetical protein